MVLRSRAGRLRPARALEALLPRLVVLVTAVRGAVIGAGVEITPGRAS